MCPYTETWEQWPWVHCLSRKEGVSDILEIFSSEWQKQWDIFFKKNQESIMTDKFSYIANISSAWES